MRIPLILHERRGRWARQIAPRVANWPVAVVETRSGDELARAARRSACPLVVIDARDRGPVVAEDLDRLTRAASEPLVLVVAPDPSAEFRSLARELGATRVVPSAIAPPAVMDLLLRWLPLAQARAGASGWAEDRTPEPEPWEALLDLAPGSLVARPPA